MGGVGGSMGSVGGVLGLGNSFSVGGDNVGGRGSVGGRGVEMAPVGSSTSSETLGDENSLAEDALMFRRDSLNA